MSRKGLFLVLLIIGTAFWGISYSVTKWAIHGQSTATFLFWRFIGATLVLALLFRRYFKKMDRAALATGVFLGVPLVMGTLLLTQGIRQTSASQAAFISGICVVLVPLFKMLLYRSAMPFKAWFSALLALAGLFVICIKGELKFSAGDLYTIAGAVSFSLYLIAVERKSAVGEIIPTIVPMFATCAVITGGLALFDTSANWLPVSTGFWTGVGYCALFSTAYMYTVSNIAQKYISAEKVAIIYLLEPVFGALAAYYMLQEELSWRLLAGGGMIFVATVISEVELKGKGKETIQPDAKSGCHLT
ncbi:DMT family transporter [Chitinophaga sp. CB10]|uniref:DMT family transporter n=1 Tax=Chitinophaga sp. CB10 TaxID=1891659 RepID=UPI000A8D2C2A|nr:DMT family transporter [Chitinophaga sp. CB10]